MNRLTPALPAMLCLYCAIGYSQSLGTAPSLTLDVTDVYAAFRLPPLRDNADGGLASVLSDTQVGQRATLLELNGQSSLGAWTGGVATLQSAETAVVAPSADFVQFTGPKASDLNAILARGASVAVAGSSLTVDQPIEIRKSGVTLDLGQTQLTAGGAMPYLLRIEGVSGVAVRGGAFASGEAGILVNSSDHVRIENVGMHGLTSHGIVVTGSSYVTIARNRIMAMSGAAILLHRGTTFSVVEHNEIAGNLGASNVTAGIVLSDREVDLAEDPKAIFGGGGYWVVSEPLPSRLHPPHDNVIAFNHVAQNASSGVYVDGGVRNVIASNTIEGNAKEGLCLDNGSTANVVTANTITRNGNRWGESDWVLQEDSVLDGGRLPDGTPAEKTPGISIDNAIYNLVFANGVAHNFGGGIKVVRTGYFNLIGLNTVFSDNDGASSAFHFFGIELGSAAPDDQSVELDFTPSEGNIVFSNSIRGTHYSGIFFAEGSDQNDVFDNTILDATNWALESVSVMANHTLNNLTNLPSRNVGSGIDPALVGIGQPVMDPDQSSGR